jgi:hypothetical protein
MYCKNLLKRQHKYKPYFYCKALRKEIILPCDKNCSKLILVTNKPIKKVSNKGITVTEETYNKVMQRDNYKCRLSHVTYNGVSCYGGLELHHIKYRSEAKDLINEPTNCIMLCTRHHKLVHSNKHYWQPILKEMIKNERI